jgi:hypothetical protein
MPRDAMCPRNTSAHEQANVTDGAQQSYATKEKVRPGRKSIL